MRLATLHFSANDLTTVSDGETGGGRGSSISTGAFLRLSDYDGTLCLRGQRGSGQWHALTLEEDVLSC